MALVCELCEQKLEKGGLHEKVRCTYSIVDGQLQIDTYGSEKREVPGQKSQTIRFTKEAVAQLKAILEKHFPNVSSH